MDISCWLLPGPSWLFRGNRTLGIHIYHRLDRICESLHAYSWDSDTRPGMSLEKCIYLLFSGEYMQYNKHLPERGENPFSSPRPFYQQQIPGHGARHFLHNEWQIISAHHNKSQDLSAGKVFHNISCSAAVPLHPDFPR